MIVFVFRSTRDATYNEEEGSVRMFLRGRPINLYAPTAEIASYDITKVATAPSSKLKLDWVYPFLLYKTSLYIMILYIYTKELYYLIYYITIGIYI